MKLLQSVVSGLGAVGLAALMLASVAGNSRANAEEETSPLVQRGKYLVTLGGCGDCHTPIKIGKNGPEPDMERLLSGHPESVKLPSPPTLTNEWAVVTFPLTAWSGPWGITYAQNLTPDEKTGMGIWTEDMFIKAMRTGKHFGTSRPILPPMPWQSIGQLTEEDLKAIFSYLKSIPPIKNHVPDPVPPGGNVAE